MTDELLVIGLAGAAGVGKDEVAQHLVRRHGFTRLAFADPLKSVCEVYFGWNWRKDERGRRLLQEVGMAARRYNPDHWVAVLQKQMALLMGSPDHRRFVISDCRFFNELELVWKMRGISPGHSCGHLWRIDRPGGGLDGELAAHTSEQEWRSWVEWSTVIRNEASLDRLRTAVDVELAAIARP